MTQSNRQIQQSKQLHQSNKLHQSKKLHQKKTIQQGTLQNHHTLKYYHPLNWCFLLFFCLSWCTGANNNQVKCILPQRKKMEKYKVISCEFVLSKRCLFGPFPWGETMRISKRKKWQIKNAQVVEILTTIVILIWLKI